MVTLQLPRPLWGKIDVHARHNHPNETCGLILGTRDPIARRATEAHTIPNIYPQPRHRYRMDPEAQLAVYRHADQAGLEILAIWHTHPHTDPDPSPADIETANYADPLMLHLILSTDPDGNPRRHRLWYPDPYTGQTVDAKLEITP